MILKVLFEYNSQEAQRPQRESYYCVERHIVVAHSLLSTLLNLSFTNRLYGFGFCGRRTRSPARSVIKPGVRRDNPGDKNEQGIHQIFGRHVPLLQTGPDPEHGLRALDAGKIRADKACQNDQGQCVERPDERAHFDEKVELHNRDNSES